MSNHKQLQEQYYENWNQFFLFQQLRIFSISYNKNINNNWHHHRL